MSEPDRGDLNDWHNPADLLRIVRLDLIVQRLASVDDSQASLGYAAYCDCEQCTQRKAIGDLIGDARKLLSEQD
jgi:hypothetical protein